MTVRHPEPFPDGIVFGGQLNNALCELLHGGVGRLKLKLESCCLASESCSLCDKDVDVPVGAIGSSHVGEHLLVLQLLPGCTGVGLSLNELDLELVGLVLVALELAGKVLLLRQPEADVGLLMEKIKVILTDHLELPENLVVLRIGDALGELPLKPLCELHRVGLPLLQIKDALARGNLNLDEGILGPDSCLRLDFELRLKGAVLAGKRLFVDLMDSDASGKVAEGLVHR
mmetsp:Transcript_23294/g.48443  ORF Transcript_23294/g.48443 Transcript_23294/m.48443 type:complete len:230 (-) Transcript_23294:2764-3453(-)